MPVAVNRETDKAVAFRCEKHREVPVLNLSADQVAECGICCMDQVADDVLPKLCGQIIDSAVAQLNFFSPGAGEHFRSQAARIIDSWAEPEPTPAAPAEQETKN
jgi:hypothetical protein